MELTRPWLTDLRLLHPNRPAWNPVLDMVSYGHVRDSNLHLDIAVRRYDKELEKALDP